MQIKTDGLVLSAKNYNDDDKLLTILTRDMGVVYVFAGGARKMKSRLGVASSPLCYADFVLFKNKEKYVCDSAEVKTLFYGIREDLESVSLACYICEIATAMAPSGERADDVLRLLLNILYMLEKKKMTYWQLKAVTELRFMSMGGYLPNLLACAHCGNFERGPFWFSMELGDVICNDCIGKDKGGRYPMSLGVFNGARHIVYSPLEKLFSFSLGEDAQKELSNISEKYLFTHTDREYKTLDFLNDLRRTDD